MKNYLGKYEDDQAWYRCIITDYNKNKKTFELFYIDFGNIEIASKEDILYGWSAEHVQVFKNYEAQAIKCKLYGLKSPNKDHFSDEENQTFKEHVSDKIFKPKFIKYNTEEDIFEVSLNDASCADPLLSSVHNFLTNKSLGKI